MSKKQTIHEIGESIKSHYLKEKSKGIGNYAIARSYLELRPTFGSPRTETIWLTNKESIYGGKNLYGDGRLVYKNTKLGEMLTMYYHGEHSYVAKGKINATIYNRAVYNPSYSGIEGIKVNDESGVLIPYKDLNQLLHDKEFMEEQLEKERAKAAEEKKREAERKAAIEKARKEREEAERKEREAREARERAEREAAEEAARIEAEREAEEARIAAEEARKREEARIREEEEAKRRLAYMQELEEGIKNAELQVELIHSVVRKDVSLRSQHILDPSQETAKRSHVFDGVPLVIEGGPGTGKTTTMIQRLKFLISREALNEYDNPLSKAQIEKLTDPLIVSQNWLFFSPTTQLLQYLRHNMHEEDLQANELNTTVLSSLNGKLMQSYKLHDPEKNGPFKLPRKLKDGEEVMIKNPKAAITAFEKYCIRELTKKMLAAFQLNTSNYSWHSLAIEIKSLCKRAENIKDMDALIRLVNSLEDNYKKKVGEVETELSKNVKARALDLQVKIEEDEVKVAKLQELFLKWKEETYAVVDEDDDIEEDEDEEEDSMVSQSIDFKPELFKNLKPIIKKLSLKSYDSKTKLSKRQKEVYDIIVECLEGINLDKVGELSWFVKNYSSLCKGVANAVLNQYVRLYKGYRKQALENGSTSFNKKLLEQYVQKKENKPLHPDELHLLVGFINRQLYSIYKKSRLRFDTLSKNKYVQAYKENVRYVIGVDEATDYSWLDYYLITSLRHYEFSSITLCGDSMQGLSSEGILDWKELEKDLLPNIEVAELVQSYRQTAVLVDMARKMYEDEKGVEAPYDTAKIHHSTDAKPLAFISDDEEEKAEWMAHRIVEVFKRFEGTMPTVAIFVGDNEDITELKDLLEEQDCLNSIEIADCSEGKTTTVTKCVRIFRMKEVKGMEFEVAFFHNIDTALAGNNTDLMRRYLYVGISRASSHLAATFCDSEGNEDILKYFDLQTKNWKI